MVVDADTGQPVPNQTVYCNTYYLRETWLFGHGFSQVPIDGVEVKTDENGKFTAVMTYKNGTDQVNCGFSENDDYYGAGYEFNDTVISEINAKRDIYTLKVKQYQKINLRIKNANPMDDNDKFSVGIMVKNTYRAGGELYKIVNYGKANEKFTPPASDNGLNPFWIGKDIDAELSYKVTGSPVLFVFHSIKGTDTLDYQFTEEIPIERGVINNYSINY
ncbi:MAG: hypothetical protein Q4G48_09100 [Bacteroidia bacterium]|nr:hypothetical protein [Bacteroidia bacterium]